MQLSHEYLFVSNCAARWVQLKLTQSWMHESSRNHHKQGYLLDGKHSTIYSLCKKVKNIRIHLICNISRSEASFAWNRMTGYSYSTKGSLTSCEKQCGSTTNSDNIFCVGSSDTCPINYLQIGTTADSSITSIQSITIEAGYFLFYSREGPGAPIVDLRVTKGAGVCLDNTINNLYSTSSPFILLN